MHRNSLIQEHVVVINAAKYAIKIVFKFVKLKNHPQNKKISKSLSVKVKTNLKTSHLISHIKQINYAM